MTSNRSIVFDLRSGFLWALVAVPCVVFFGKANAQVNSASDGPAQAELGAKRSFTVVPRFSLVETISNNVALSGNNPNSAQITELNPGVRITSDGARFKAYFDYSLRVLSNSQEASKWSQQNALNTFGSFEAIDNLFFIDFSSVIAQQAISAFGVQSPSNSLPNANLTESSNSRISPYLKGQFAGAINYFVRLSLSKTSSEAAATSDSSVRDVSLSLADERKGSKFGWRIDANQQNTTNKVAGGRATETGMMRGSLTYDFTPQFAVNASWGKESNNLTTFESENRTSSGYGANWRISEVTNFSFARDNRFFGESHSLNFDHRTGRTAWRFSDSTNIASPQGQFNTGSIGQVYDLLFLQFATVEPDPGKRALLVDSFIALNGLIPSAQATSGFLTSAASVQRRQDVSFAILGIRDTMTFTATQTSSRRLDTLVQVADDFAASAIVRQRGFSMNVAHRLTPGSNLSVLVSRQSASGTVEAQKTATRMANLSLSTKVGDKSSASLTARRVLFESTVNPYSESALTGNLNVQF